jgi:hypothetical protein
MLDEVSMSKCQLMSLYQPYNDIKKKQKTKSKEKIQFSIKLTFIALGLLPFMFLSFLLGYEELL